MQVRERIIFFLGFLAAMAAAIGVTVWFIDSGIDWDWAVWFNRNDIWVAAATPFVLLGMIIPLAIPAVFYIRSRRRNSARDYINYKRSLFTFITSYVVMTVLKVVTNRVDMEPFEPIGSVDFSGEFRFGFLNSSSFWESFSEGWPSGHTMIALSMAVALYPHIQSKIVRNLHLVYAALIALSVSTAFHWLSDVFAGAFIGLVIGLFYARYSFGQKSPL